MSSTAPVNMPDEVMAEKIKVQLRPAFFSLDPPITRMEMEKLRWLRMSQLGIRDLTGLEHAKNMEDLIVNGNRIEDITPLAEAKKLQRLLIAENQVTDLSPISELPVLTTLNCDNNQIDSISPIVTNTPIDRPMVKIITLHGNPIVDKIRYIRKRLEQRYLIEEMLAEIFGEDIQYYEIKRKECSNERYKEELVIELTLVTEIIIWY